MKDDSLGKFIAALLMFVFLASLLLGTLRNFESRLKALEDKAGVRPQACSWCL